MGDIGPRQRYFEVLSDRADSRWRSAVLVPTPTPMPDPELPRQHECAAEPQLVVTPSTAKLR